MECSFNDAIKIRKTDWTLFKDCLEAEPATYNVWSTNIIELETSQITKLLNKALKKSTFSTFSQPARQKWWNESLNTLKWNCIKLAKKCKVSNTEENKNMFLLAKKDFQREVRKSKRNSWNSFLESIEDPKSLAFLTKALSKKPQENVGLLKKTQWILQDSTGKC